MVETSPGGAHQDGRPVTTSPPSTGTPSCDFPCDRDQECPREPIDAVERIAAHYRVVLPELPAGPEAIGLALTLLINRNDGKVRPIRRSEWCVADRIEIDTALCGAAEVFTGNLTRAGSCLEWRGGALASLRGLAGAALTIKSDPLNGTATRLWVKREPLIPPVVAWLHHAWVPRAIARAFDALTEHMRNSPDFYRPLAVRGQLHERAGDTMQLRETVVGVAR